MNTKSFKTQTCEVDDRVHHRDVVRPNVGSDVAGGDR